MLIGSKITAQRKHLKMSQVELAEGICTQATLSKMEKQNIAPMTDTLVKICLRLNLTVNDVLTDFSDNRYQQQLDILENVQISLSQINFKKAKKIFNSLDPKEIVGKLNSRYRFMKGYIELIVDANYTDAIFDFGIAIQLAEDNAGDLLIASTGMGTLYAIKGDIEKASYYFEHVLFYADGLEINKTNIVDYIRALNNASKFYSDIGEFNKSNKISHQVIEIVRQTLTLQFIDTNYYRIAFNLFKEDPKKYRKEIMSNIESAKFFAKLYENKEVLKYINELEKDVSKSKQMK